MNRRSILGVLASLAFAMVSLIVVAGPAHADALDDVVARFYGEVLDRVPDPTEAAAWSTFLLGNCNASGFGTLARSFFGSPEFVQTKRLTLEQLVAKFYRALLGREPDSEGLAAWVEVLRQARLTMALSGFVASTEFLGVLPDRANRTTVTAVVTSLYVEILQRLPEPAGLASWVDHIVATGDLEGAAAGFLASTEFESRALTLPEFVTILYRAFLGREPEPAGLGDWVGVVTQALLAVINVGFVPSRELEQLSAAVCPPVVLYAGAGRLSTATDCVGFACLFFPPPCAIGDGSGPATARVAQLGQRVGGSASLVANIRGFNHALTFDLGGAGVDQAGQLNGRVQVVLEAGSLGRSSGSALVNGSLSPGGISFQFQGSVTGASGSRCGLTGSVAASQ